MANYPLMPLPSSPQFLAGMRQSLECVTQGQAQAALDIAVPLLAETQDPFRRSYLLGLVASMAAGLGRYPEALQAYQDALHDAETISWPDFITQFSFELGELYLHLGQGKGAEAYLLRALREWRQSGNRGGERQTLQALANAYLAQGKLVLAEKTLMDLKALLGKTPTVATQLASLFLEGRIALALGEKESVRRVILALKNLLGSDAEGPLWPYLGLLEGKVALMDGHYQASIEILQRAAQGFAKNGDGVGQVEALLAMTAPMLEFQWISEARRVLHPLAVWEGINQYPALQQAIQLRRLALSAFLGIWVKRDLELMRQDPLEQGSLEEWIPFWFHLSLAASRLGDRKLAEEFLQKSKQLAESIVAGLDTKKAKKFKSRPDMARLFRLSDQGPKVQQVVREQKKILEGPASAATVAPPGRPKK